MEISTHYDPNQIEQHWYEHWLEQGFFRAQPNPHKAPYTIIMPPPNITGVLHMGHVLNNTIQDVLVRKARMQGKEACWVPGLDHASIATEAKVVAMLQEKKISKQDLDREAFLKHAWEWKEKYGGIILDQLKKLGASCDWERTRFTMENAPSEAVQEVFIQLYEKGYIYQGTRIIHWDPVGRTALADEEVTYKPVASQLYYIRYAIIGSKEPITIATTRPETILGDTAVCIHPDDSRYQHLHGKQAIVPIIGRAIPIIADTYVDPTFGTGCLKVTPAHDMNDYQLGKQHNLPIIDILNEDGTLNEAAQYWVGEDRFVAREKIAHELQSRGCLEKVEPHTSHIGFSERTHAIVEPRVSKQWFVDIHSLAKPALEHVLDGTIQFHPAKFKNMYQSWLEKVQDWCISRQLWWGHQIPAFYLPDGQVIVAKSKADALQKASANPAYHNLTEADLKQDEDVLDTWFSSWLWPMTVFDGFKDPHNADMQYFYPTNDIVTAPEIIFFWIARMIMAGYAFTNKPPFRHVYFTGIVRDKEGKKMSKSLGNSPDPIQLMKEYSTDGVRVGMLLSAPAGNDLLFDVKLCDQGKKFSNKLWNAFRLIKSWEAKLGPNQQETNMAVVWFEARFNQILEEIENHFVQFRISDALMAVYKLIWDDFCAWYLEMIKPAYGQTLSGHTYKLTINFLERILKVLHPFMPFITEEIWHQIQVRSPKDCVIVASWPELKSYDPVLLQEANLAFNLVSHIRHARSSAQVSTKEPIRLHVVSAMPDWLTKFMADVTKLAFIDRVTIAQTMPQGATSFNIQGYTFFMLLEQPLDIAQEKERLKKELIYYQGFLESINKKLNNERFLQNAPEQVLSTEYNKQKDTAAKIKLLQAQLQQLG
jgi:valyl-tRNA synthetase